MPISKPMRRLPPARSKPTAPQASAPRQAASASPAIACAEASIPMGDYRYAPSAIQRRRADAPGAAAPPSPSAASHAGGSQQPLPAPLQAGLEQLGGVALGHARVHYDSPLPARYAASAYARGADIHLAPGRRQDLPHEGWHLVQQAQGRVAASTHHQGSPFNDSPALEHEADRMGQRAQRLGATASGRAATASTTRESEARTAPQAGKGVLQARLTVNKQLIDVKDAGETVDTLADKIDDATLKEQYTAYLGTHRERLLHVVHKWAAAPGHQGIKGFVPLPPDGDKPVKARARAYDSSDSFATALLAEARSQDKKRNEKAYAQEIVGNQDIRQELVGLIAEQIPQALDSYATTIDKVAKLNPKNRRTYLEYVRSNQATTIERVLTAPDQHSFGELVAAIHDVQELLYQTRNAALQPDVPDEQERNLLNPHALHPLDYRGSTLSEDGKSIERTLVDRAWRGPDATPRPSNPHVRTAMLLDNPTDMGPSMTAARMFVLAAAGGARSHQIEALALALFAFWNRTYRRDITDIHRYHFTMDMAANFGVDYDPTQVIDKETRDQNDLRRREKREKYRQAREAFNLADIDSEFDDYEYIY
ncbi:eCIS core domain-containing protein [Burkholderia gladioli]|uniref:eCIS core domain-containing protein n=1 Tax=Burkholderia gladioli TaxID=28095 RepID=UPI0009E279DF|nr:DUF4157 domain-containing protein [Burkholderia gladioli]